MRLITVALHVYAAFELHSKEKQVVAEDPTSVYDYYMRIWKWFYASYLILPLAA